jgi:hypothetical protein
MRTTTSGTPIYRLAALALLLAGASASALEFQLHPGAMCVQLGQDPVTVRYGGRGEVVNSSFITTATVICPLVRTFLIQRPDEQQVTALVTDSNPDQNVICGVHTFGEFRGDNLQTAQPDQPLPEGFSSGKAHLDFALPKEPATGVMATYFITCDIPPAVVIDDALRFSGVLRYFLFE